MNEKEILQYDFSDLYIDSNHTFYISDENILGGLEKVDPIDKDEFCNYIQSIPQQEPSYIANWKDTIFRVERTLSKNGNIYCLRRMPDIIPNIHQLGYSHYFTQYMLSLAKSSGLILWGGPTGSGKTTSISSLLAEYLNLHGGFAYTIEDPPEMPLDGEYKAINGSLGLCKQTEVINDNWKDPLKSALRSHPRYILIGEIRTTDAAQECLRAAISGHLVLTSIHANSVAEAISSLVKYASYNMSEASAYDILSRGLLAVVKQEISSVKGKKVPSIETLFANPETTKACQVRSIIKIGNLNLATSIEMQANKIKKGMPIF